ncbi:MAG: PHP domain-containing protein [Nanoarchaeota archaeon]
MSRYIRGRAVIRPVRGTTFFDLHMHSDHSGDCRMSVKDILALAKKEGFGISITDHNEISGSLEALKQEEVPVVPGIEITANDGIDLLCYFATQKGLVAFFNKVKTHRKKDLLKSNKLSGLEIIELCHKHHGVVSLAHPFRYILRIYNIVNTLPVIRGYFRHVDAIEVVNGKTPQAMNRRARTWARRLKIPYTSGSDAHHMDDFLSTFTLFKTKDPEAIVEAIRKGDTTVIGKGTKVWFKLLRSGKNVVVKWIEKQAKGTGSSATH